jgi:acyl-CoA thioester hydrolase
MRSPSRLPDTQAIRELPVLTSIVIPEKWQDQNGHVNVSFYMSMYMESGWPMFNLIGIDESYFSDRQMGFVDLENHFRYLSELHVGDRVTVFGRFLAHDEKRIHGIVLAVNDDTDVLASTIEFLAISMDLQTRRAAKIPGDIAAKVAGATSKDQRLAWTVPTRLSIPA